MLKFWLIVSSFMSLLIIVAVTRKKLSNSYQSCYELAQESPCLMSAGTGDMPALLLHWFRVYKVWPSLLHSKFFIKKPSLQDKKIISRYALCKDQLMERRSIGQENYSTSHWSLLHAAFSSPFLYFIIILLFVSWVFYVFVLFYHENIPIHLTLWSPVPKILLTILSETVYLSCVIWGMCLKNKVSFRCYMRTICSGFYDMNKQCLAINTLI